MSNKDLDSLFKNKLEDHSTKPNNDLWAAIDAQLPKKRYIPNYWLIGIAASLFIVIGIGIGFYISSKSVNQIPQLANRTATKKSVKPITDEVETVKPEKQKGFIAQSSTNDTEKEVSKNTMGRSTENMSQLNSIKPTKNKNKETVKTIPTNSIEPVDNLNNIIKTEITDASLEENIAKIEVPDATNEIEVASTKQDASNTLVFDISEFTKENKVTSANTQEEKKESKLKQLYNIAKDIKQGESGLSELREAKNDLFAMNTRKNDKGE